MTLVAHRVVLAVKADVELVDSGAFGMLVTLARCVAAVAHVREMAPVIIKRT